jgi:hypothetical protein
MEDGLDDQVHKRKARKKQKKNKRDKKRKIRPQIERRKNAWIFDLLKRKKSMGESFTKNYIFWSVYVLSISCLSLRYGKQSTGCKNIIGGFLTTISCMIIGWSVHLWVHINDFQQTYEDILNSETIFSKVLNSLPTFVHKIIIWICGNVLDFHDKIHHDSSVNEIWYNVLMEASENILMEGGLIVVLSRMFNLGLRFHDEVYVFNHSISLVWALLYTTVHLINYKLIRSNTHTDHHKNCYTNFGIDTLDIVFNTKYDINKPEIFNHGAINMTLLTALIIFIKETKFKNNVITFLRYILN